MIQTLSAGTEKWSDVRMFHTAVSDKTSRLSEKYSLCTGETVAVTAVTFVLVVLLNFRM